MSEEQQKELERLDKAIVYLSNRLENVLDSPFSLESDHLHEYDRDLQLSQQKRQNLLAEMAKED